MPLFQWVLAGGIVYASQKSYQKLKCPQKLGDILDPVVPSTDPHPIVCLVEQIDQACQQLVREKLDPLLVGSNRQQQMSLLTTSESADSVSEEEKLTNTPAPALLYGNRSITLGSVLEGFDFEALLADRGYDTDKILDFVTENGAEAVIPAKKNRLVQRDTDWHTYKSRHLVECFMNKIKHYRRIFSRFEKYASRYLSFLSFASALIWLR